MAVVVLPTHLEIDAVPMSTPAWEHTNLYMLLGAGAARGDNVIMPGARGRWAVRRYPDQANFTLELTIFGDFDWDGVVQPDPVAGLVRNIEYLHANVIDPLPPTDSLRVATIVMPATTLTAHIQVLGFEISEGYGPAAVSASMDIAVLEGRFA